MSKVKFSKEIVNDKLSSKGIVLVGDYEGSLIKTEFQCECGFRWFSTPNNVLQGKSKHLKCKDIIGGSGNRPGAIWRKLSKDEVNARILDTGIVQLGDYVNSRTKTEFQCRCGCKWESTPNNILEGNGCPVCAERGYNPNKPGWIYILIFETFIKYGITNNTNRRFKDHEKNGRYTVALSKLYEDGKQAQLWERNIKIIFGGRFVSKEIMPDGYTETLSLDKLQALLDTIR